MTQEGGLTWVSWGVGGSGGFKKGVRRAAAGASNYDPPPFRCTKIQPPPLCAFCGAIGAKEGRGILIDAISREKSPQLRSKSALQKKHLKGRFRSSWTIQKNMPPSLILTQMRSNPLGNEDMATFGNQIMIVGPPHNYSPSARTRLEANRWVGPLYDIYGQDGSLILDALAELGQIKNASFLRKPRYVTTNVVLLNPHIAPPPFPVGINRTGLCPKLDAEGGVFGQTPISLPLFPLPKSHSICTQKLSPPTPPLWMGGGRN